MLENSSDIYVLTESKDSEGCKYIYNSMTKRGWNGCFPSPNHRNLGVIMLSKYDIKGIDYLYDRDDELYGRYIEIKIDNNGEVVTIVGVYVPSRDRSEAKINRKKRFVNDVCMRLPYFPKHTVICGDFNIISREHFPKYNAFFKWEYDMFDILKENRYIESYNCLYPGKQVYSWIGRTGNGYKYDYVFVSQSMKKLIQTCSYIDTTREGDCKLTDHSAVEIKLQIG